MIRPALEADGDAETIERLVDALLPFDAARQEGLLSTDGP